MTEEEKEIRQGQYNIHNSLYREWKAKYETADRWNERYGKLLTNINTSEASEYLDQALEYLDKAVTACETYYKVGARRGNILTALNSDITLTKNDQKRIKDLITKLRKEKDEWRTKRDEAEYEMNYELSMRDYYA